ncbi:MAG: hypothetical protein LBT92_01930 [Rickettsiales bacterium]|jgi:hypothetical protein|nr:hypothetical protein [Rickettsiales bacterium]
MIHKCIKRAFRWEMERKMESKNKTILSSIIDGILEDTVWVNASGETVSLKEAIARNIHIGRGAELVALDRRDLLGAYTSFQIKRQSFGTSTRDMTEADLAAGIKSFIFEEAHGQMVSLEAEVGAFATGSRRAA